MRYDVTTRRIFANGAWEEWEHRVEAADEVAALAKLLRRRGTAEWLLSDDRFRFSVKPAE